MACGFSVSLELLLARRRARTVLGEGQE